MKDLLKQHPVIAILRHTPDEDLECYVRSLYEGGIRSFELSFTTKDAISQLKWMKRNMPKDTFIGAGTILTEKDAAIAAEAGADYLLSPSTDVKVMEFCSEHKIRFMPGVFTPSDVSVCQSYGYKTLKLFPAGNLTKGYIKSLKGPFPDTEYVAVGGVSPANAMEYFNEGYVGVGIGSSLVNKRLFEEKNWRQISCDIKCFVDLLKERKVL
jgi:2-dehydro-3-deoxyphosphogluconate aldolase/(4S)-4-hydroxy-2-oxoglutarate aldolase